MKTNDCLSPKGLGCVRWRGRVWLGLALAGLALAARAPADDTNAAPVKDFGAGFAKFLALGLPDVKEARYVRLESSYGQAYEVRTERLKLEGNAWLLAEQPDKTARVLLGRTKVRELVDPQKLQKELAEKMKQARAQGGRAMMTLGDRRLGGTWKAADPKKDCDAILSYLQQSSTNEEDRGGYELKALTPSLFLSATHYYRTGLTNEANRIAQALFDRAGDARKVILGAMNQLADSQYEELFGDFSARPDWRAFAQGLQALLQRYPSGWRMAPAVRRLAERVKARAEQAVPPAVTSAGLTEEDRQLAAELAQSAVNGSSLQYLQYRQNLWVLPSSRGAPRRLGLPGAPPWQKITQRGMKAVPLLLALAKDEYLLPAESSGASFSHSDYGGWRGSSSGNSEEAVEQMYQQLSRPVTRGEVARALLQQVLPRREDSSREELDPDTLVEEVQRWYQDTGKQTPEELTTWYLEHGDQAQQQIAVAALVKTGATNNFARVEAFMLEHADELLRDGSSAGEYVRQRGRAALPFLQKLEAAALTPKKKKVAEEEEDGVIQRDDREEKAQREVLGAWRKLAEAPPAEEILREVAQHPESWAKYENVLGQQLRGPAAGKALDLLLETTIGMKDLKVRRDLLDLVWHPLYTLGRSDEKEEEPDEDAPPAAADPALTAAMAAFLTKHASAWQTLLADERPLPTAPGDADDVATFADVAAQWIERLFGREPGAENAPPGLWDAMGQALIKARARARLAHQPLPGWPKAERVTPARRAEIAARLQAAGVAELAAVVQGLTDDEKLALSEETAQRAELQKVLRPLAFSVQRVQVNGSTGELARAVLPWAGRPLTKSDVDKLIEVSRGLAAAGQSAHLKLWRGQGLTGFRVAVTEYDRTMPEYRQMFDWMIEELDHEQPARVAANLYAGERCGAFEWMVAVPAKAGVAAPVKTGSGGADVLDDMLDELKTDTSSWREEGQKQFTALLEDLFKGEAPLDWHVRLDVVVSPAIKPAGKPASGGKAGASEPVAIPWMQDLE